MGVGQISHNLWGLHLFRWEKKKVIIEKRGIIRVDCVMAEGGVFFDW